MTKTGHHKWKVILIPFSWLYGLVIWIRNWLYDTGLLQSTGFSIPMISVGNINVGGTGKTPHVEYLADLLGDRYRVATLSRGYKRKTRDFRFVSPGSIAGEVGDEPLQIKRRFPNVTVAVDRNRVNGIGILMRQDPPVEVIILDDAYQHRSVKPGFSILLIDFNHPLESDRMLPAGRLREPASNHDRANIILITRSPEHMKPIELREYVNRAGISLGQHLYFTTIRYGDLLPVFPGVPARTSEWFKNSTGAVLIVAGIANPNPLREYALGITPHIFELFYRDHHRYSVKDMEKIYDKYRELKKTYKEVLVLTTEKDAVRFQDHDPEPELKNALYSVRIHVHFLHDDKDEFDRHILNYVNNNKRSSILYQGKDS